MANIYERITLALQHVQFGIGTIGIIGNLLVIVICARKSLRGYSFSVYSIVKAIADIVVLLYNFRNWASFIVSANLDVVNPFFCRMSLYISNSAILFALWMLCLMSADRLFTIVYPNRFKTFKKKWFQIMIVLVILIYSFVISLSLPINAFIYELNLGFQVLKFCITLPNVLNDYLIIYFSNVCASTFVVSNLINYKVIRFIAQSRRRIANNNGQRNSSSKDRKFAVTAVGLGLTALICKLPVGIGVLVANMSNTRFDIYLMISHISICISTLENAAGFFVNLFVNSIFKNEVFRVVGLRSNINNHVGSSSNSVTKNGATKIIVAPKN